MVISHGWNVTNPNAVRVEMRMRGGTRADYLLRDRNGRSLAVIDVKCTSVSPNHTSEQAKCCLLCFSSPSTATVDDETATLCVANQ